jgi:hypothetical protein
MNIFYAKAVFGAKREAIGKGKIVNFIHCLGKSELM